MSNFHTKNFSHDELKCKCGCETNNINQYALSCLQRFRDYFGKQMILNSAYRCPDWNDEVSKTGKTGPHTTGQAFDIKIYGADAFTLQSTVGNYGFHGIGIKQKGDYSKRFIHIDTIPEKEGDSTKRPWIWSY